MSSYESDCVIKSVEVWRDDDQVYITYAYQDGEELTGDYDYSFISMLRAALAAVWSGEPGLRVKFVCEDA